MTPGRVTRAPAPAHRRHRRQTEPPAVTATLVRRPTPVRPGPASARILSSAPTVISAMTPGRVTRAPAPAHRRHRRPMEPRVATATRVHKQTPANPALASARGRWCAPTAISATILGRASRRPACARRPRRRLMEPLASTATPARRPILARLVLASEATRWSAPTAISAMTPGRVTRAPAPAQPRHRRRTEPPAATATPVRRPILARPARASARTRSFVTTATSAMTPVLATPVPEPVRRPRPRLMELPAATATLVRKPTRAKRARAWARTRWFAPTAISAITPAPASPKLGRARRPHRRRTEPPAATATLVRRPILARLVLASEATRSSVTTATSAMTPGRVTRAPAPAHRPRPRLMELPAATATLVRKPTRAKRARAWARTRWFAPTEISAMTPAPATPVPARAHRRHRRLMELPAATATPVRKPTRAKRARAWARTRSSATTAISAMTPDCNPVPAPARRPRLRRMERLRRRQRCTQTDTCQAGACVGLEPGRL
jgi:hypothetical protein